MSRTRLSNFARPFLFGVATGLLMALWWRAAQIQQRDRDFGPPGMSEATGMSPDQFNP